MLATLILSPLSPHPGLINPPRCLVCREITQRETIDNPNNPNGNDRRPYFFCNCGKFSCFGDMRGVLAENPLCDCLEQWPSRLQVTGADRSKLIPRALHYRCAVGGCRFFTYLADRDGNIITLPAVNLNRDDVMRLGL
jgi:hypothetical protein